MRILFATSSFAGGGITSYAHEFIRAYSIGNELSVLIGNDDNNPIVYTDVNVYKYECSNTAWSNVKKVANLINEVIKPEIIVSSNARIIVLASPYLTDSVRIITVSHSLKYIDADISALNNGYIDNIIALSNFNKEYLDNSFRIRDALKVRVIYNFISERDNAFEIRNNKKHNEVVSIVFPGGCEPPKTPELVIHVLKELLKTDALFKFYWVGKRNLRVSKAIPFFRINDVGQYIPKDDRVVLTGRLSREECEDLFARTNIFLFPSRREGCSMSLLETMRVGTIAIVSDYHNANMEMIHDGYNGFVINHNNVEEFVSRIVDICKNHKNYESVYDNSYDSFVSSYSRNVWKKQMDDVILSSSTNHNKRHKRISFIKYLRDVCLLRYFELDSLVKQLFEERLLVIFKIKQIKKAR